MAQATYEKSFNRVAWDAVDAAEVCRDALSYFGHPPEILGLLDSGISVRLGPVYYRRCQSANDEPALSLKEAS